MLTCYAVHPANAQTSEIAPGSKIRVRSELYPNVVIEGALRAWTGDSLTISKVASPRDFMGGPVALPAQSARWLEFERPVPRGEGFKNSIRKNRWTILLTTVGSAWLWYEVGAENPIGVTALTAGAVVLSTGVQGYLFPGKQWETVPLPTTVR